MTERGSLAALVPRLYSDFEEEFPSWVENANKLGLNDFPARENDSEC